MKRGKVWKGVRRIVSLYGVTMILVLLCAACSSKQHQHVWEERYIVATQAQDQGDFEAAEAHYTQLVKHAPDEERRAAAAFKQATLFEERGEFERALEAYEALYSSEIDPQSEAAEYQARAIYRAARLQQDRFGDEARAEALFIDLLRHHGKWVAAEHALALLERRYVAQMGEEGARDQLSSYLQESQGTPLYGHILFTLARLSGSDHERAIAYYDQVLEHEVNASLWDDALWEKGARQVKMRDWDAALATYERLATAFQEESWFIGDYTSEHADDARLERGRIYLEELGQPLKAVEEYERFLSDFEYNRSRDDAAWMRLQALKAANASELYEEGVRQFVESYPESRYVRQIPGARAEQEAP